jgi:methylglutaconyl-CoA hydratase
LGGECSEEEGPGFRAQGPEDKAKGDPSASRKDDNRNTKQRRGIFAPLRMTAYKRIDEYGHMGGVVEYRTILCSEVDGVRTIRLNRPERRNAMTAEMQEELIAAFDAAAAAPSCRVVVLAAVGGAFCAGLDLGHLEDKGTVDTEEHRVDAGRLARLFRTLHELPKPTIAAVNGAAVAGGVGLATLCDFTLAVQGAKFGYTEVKIGFVPALVSVYLMLQVGEKRARELLLMGRLFSAEEAYRVGLVTEVLEADSLMPRAQEIAGKLVANSPEAMAATKRLLVAQNRAWLDTAIEEALEANARARETKDFRAGVAAFLAKKTPVWGK